MTDPTAGDPRLSIVLPCYNEAASLPGLLAGYRETWPEYPAELILVDNGSTDSTAAVLEQELARPENHFARMVRIERNRGYGHGIATGLAAAKGNFLAWSHADLQCPAGDVFRAYEQLQRLPEPTRALVKGRRGWRGLGAFLLTHGMSLIASTVLGMSLVDINAQPKVFHRSLVEKLQAPPDGFEFDLYVLFHAKREGFTESLLEVRFDERRHGESKWAFSILSRYRTIFRVFRYILRLRGNPHP